MNLHRERTWIMRMPIRCFSLIVTMLLSAVAVSSQTPTGSIRGRVLDPNGAAVTNATVTIKENATNREITTQTNGDGFYEARNLSIGSYTVKVEQTGFSTASVENIIVQTGQVATTDVNLAVGNVGTNTVTVQGTE